MWRAPEQEDEGRERGGDGDDEGRQTPLRGPHPRVPPAREEGASLENISAA